jgi:hypothetical protein
MGQPSLDMGHLMTATRRIHPFLLSCAALPLLLSGCAGTGSTAGTGSQPMSFFVTSAGSGRGADLGGLAGADALCQRLATSTGAGNHTWRAYLSTSASGGTPAVNARDRIGRGPWRNARGELIASDVESLHARNNISKDTALTEKGQKVNGRGDQPTMHDMLTGSQPDGRAFPGAGDMTCSNWTSSGEGSAMLGHHDRQGVTQDASAMSWNSSHPSKGCSQDGLKSTGGAGLLYCFAAD